MTRIGYSTMAVFCTDFYCLDRYQFLDIIVIYHTNHDKNRIPQRTNLPLWSLRMACLSNLHGATCANSWTLS